MYTEAMARRTRAAQLRIVAALGLTAGSWLAPRASFAYCRTTTCGSQRADDCSEASRCDSGGVALFWPDATVSVVVENGSPLRDVTAEAARDVLARSMAAWTSLSCDDRSPSIGVASIEIMGLNRDAAPGAVGSAYGRPPEGDSTSALRFIDSGWPNEPKAIALTTVRYGVQSGKILSADIEANSESFDLTLVDSGGDFDLQSVLTHESGHFFGLAHVREAAATMYAQYGGGGNIDRRTLKDNDREGMCVVYPPGRFDEPSGCACAIGRTGRASNALFVAFAVLGLLRRRPRQLEPTATPSH
jgi:MYXO-CTERM domain-containing protein